MPARCRALTGPIGTICDRRLVHNDLVSHGARPTLASARSLCDLRGAVDVGNGEARTWAAVARVSLSRAQGDVAETRRRCIDALEVARRSEYRLGLGLSVFELGQVLLIDGEWAAGVTLLAAVNSRPPWLRLFLHRPQERSPDLDRARAALGDAPYEHAWAKGKAMTLDAAVAYALAVDR